MSVPMSEMVTEETQKNFNATLIYKALLAVTETCQLQTSIKLIERLIKWKLVTTPPVKGSVSYHHKVY